MSQHFGRTSAREVVQQATAFLAHVEDAPIWASMSEPTRGRMRQPDVARGRALLASAQAALSNSAAHAGDTQPTTHVIDDADQAARAWLHDQLAHVYGALHEAGDDTSLAVVRHALGDSEAHAQVAVDLRAYVALARRDDAVGRAIAATYPDAETRDHVLADGEHLADAVASALPGTGAARATRRGAVEDKEAAFDALARWLHRWSLVAHRVVGHEGLVALGLASTRKHAAKRAPAPVT